MDNSQVSQFRQLQLLSRLIPRHRSKTGLRMYIQIRTPIRGSFCFVFVVLNDSVILRSFQR